MCRSHSPFYTDLLLLAQPSDWNDIDILTLHNRTGSQGSLPEATSRLQGLLPSQKVVTRDAMDFSLSQLPWRVW